MKDQRGVRCANPNCGRFKTVKPAGDKVFECTHCGWLFEAEDDGIALNDPTRRIEIADERRAAKVERLKGGLS